jgi:hypothetical protein
LELCAGCWLSTPRLALAFSAARSASPSLGAICLLDRTASPSPWRLKGQEKERFARAAIAALHQSWPGPPVGCSIGPLPLGPSLPSAHARLCAQPPVEEALQLKIYHNVAAKVT